MLVLCNNMCIDFESVRITATANDKWVDPFCLATRILCLNHAFTFSMSIALSPMKLKIFRSVFKPSKCSEIFVLQNFSKSFMAGLSLTN